MDEIVSLRHGELFTNSLIIAQRTDNQPKSVSRLIHKHLRRIEKYGVVEFSDFKSPNSGRGRPIKIAHLNEMQALFLITLLDNNDIVLDFKGLLVEEFYRMRMRLEEKRSKEWQDARSQGKLSRRGYTDEIQRFKELAEAQGHNGSANHAFVNFSKLIKKYFGERDNATTGQLATIAAMEELMKGTIRPLVDAGQDAKAIYAACKAKAEAFAGLFVPRLN